MDTSNAQKKRFFLQAFEINIEQTSYSPFPKKPDFLKSWPIFEIETYFFGMEVKLLCHYKLVFATTRVFDAIPEPGAGGVKLFWVQLTVVYSLVRKVSCTEY